MSGKKSVNGVHPPNRGHGSRHREKSQKPKASRQPPVPLQEKLVGERLREMAGSGAVRGPFGDAILEGIRKQQEEDRRAAIEQARRRLARQHGHDARSHDPTESGSVVQRPGLPDAVAGPAVVFLSEEDRELLMRLIVAIEANTSAIENLRAPTFEQIFGGGIGVSIPVSEEREDTLNLTGVEGM